MISLVCVRCGHPIEVDDGFAGATCRCAECGTIQTVPATDERPEACQPLFAPRTAAVIASVVPEASGLSEVAEPAGDLVARAMRQRETRPTAMDEAALIGLLPKARRARSPGVPSTDEPRANGSPGPAAWWIGVAVAAAGAAVVVVLALALGHRVGEVGTPSDLAAPASTPPATVPAAPEPSESSAKTGRLR